MNRWLIFLGLILGACTPTPTPQRDLLVSAEHARLTADAEQVRAESLGRYLTATAEAPIIRITETAAALVVIQTQDSMQKTKVAESWTATPSPVPTITFTPTANATTTAVFAALNAQGTQIANNVARDNLELERQRNSNEFWTILPGIAFTIVALLGIALVLMYMRLNRYQPAKTDERGNILPMIDYVEGTATDIDAMPNYRGNMNDDLFKQWLRQKLGLKPQLPEITKERQDAVKERDQMIDLATRGLPSQKDDGRKRIATQEMAKQLSPSNLQSRFKLLDPETSDLDIIDGKIIETLDYEWKETQ